MENTLLIRLLIGCCTTKNNSSCWLTSHIWVPRWPRRTRTRLKTRSRPSALLPPLPILDGNGLKKNKRKTKRYFEEPPYIGKSISSFSTYYTPVPILTLISQKNYLEDSLKEQHTFKEKGEGTEESGMAFLFLPIRNFWMEYYVRGKKPPLSTVSQFPKVPSEM